MTGYTMKQLKAIGLIMVILCAIGLQTSRGQSAEAETMFKNHINKIVQKVKKAKNPNEKRALLNNSFDKLITALDKVGAMNVSSNDEHAALNTFRQDITHKKNELNGLAGFERVPDRQLNNFAAFVQQDFEQAALEFYFLLGVGLFLLFVWFTSF